MNDTLLLEALLATGMLSDVYEAIGAGELTDGSTLGEAIDWAMAAVDAYEDSEAES